MRVFLNVTAVVLAAALSAFAQSDSAEGEIRSFLAEYERALLKRDVAFMERVMADGYTYSSSTGTRENRAEALDYWRRERDKSSYKIISYARENTGVRVAGDAAVVTEDWTFRTVPADSPAGEPRIDRGISTMVLEKRGGVWKIVAEHESERPRDRKVMEQQVSKAGRDYNELMKRLKSGRDHNDLVKSGDIAALDRTLADEYVYTSREGEVIDKVGDLEGYKTNQTKLEAAEMLDQKVRVIGNNAAVETRTIKYKGANKGKPFDITKRYTTTWVYRAYRWQIAADHTSQVKQ